MCQGAQEHLPKVPVRTRSSTSPHHPKAGTLKYINDDDADDADADDDDEDDDADVDDDDDDDDNGDDDESLMMMNSCLGAR